MDKQLEVIVIPSGNSVQDDLVRMNTAYTHGVQARENGERVRYILSGVGPDLDKRLKQEADSQLYTGPFEGTNGLDVHPELYSESVRAVRVRYLTGKGFEPIGVDTLSLDSVQNMVNTFPPGTEGNYTIVSRALHNARFKLIERELRKVGYFSDNLKLDYVNTPDSFSVKNIAGDLTRLAKFLALDKAKIKNQIPA